MSTHLYKHMYTRPTSMSTSKKLGQLDLDLKIHEEHTAVNDDVVYH
jgi:hypothetical protein